MRPRRWGFPLLVVALLSFGCRKVAVPESSSKPAETAGQSSEPGVRHRRFGSGVSPAIVRISPDTLPVRSGHAFTERYSLEYDILGVEKANRGRVVVYSPGIGQVQAFDFQPIAHGTLEFILDAGDFDFGPTLRLRASCPEGTTDWYTFGTLPAEFAKRTADVLQIGSVTPQYVNRAAQDLGGGSAVQITMWGNRLNAQCTAEAELDNRTIELKNIFARDKQIQALILRNDLQGRPLPSRYVEVKLQLFGTGLAVEDIMYLPLREL